VGAIIFNLVTVPVGWIRAVLGCKPMVWIGKRSYGLYLWHWPLYVIIGSYWSAHPNRRDVTEFVATFIVAALSYKFIEEPFLRRKVRFQRTESMPVGLVAQEPG
jgi:peptidoglycan/LPS O-acetylase OafA/YrhL